MKHKTDDNQQEIIDALPERRQDETVREWFNRLTPKQQAKKLEYVMNLIANIDEVCDE